MSFKKNIKILTWFNFFTDFRLYSPVAIIYFAKVTGSYALGMGIFSIVMVSSALFEIPTGIFSDLIGRRKTVVLGAAAAVVYAIFYAVGQSFWILVIGALFEGLSRSFYSGNNNALLYDTLADAGKKHLYDEFLGRVSSMFQFALAISGLIGGILANWSFALVMWISVIPQIICFFLSLQLEEPKIKGSESGNIYTHLKTAYLNFVKNRRLRLLTVSSVLGYGFGEASYQFQSAFYSMVWPIWAIGIAKTITNLSAGFSYHFAGRILKKFNGLKILIIDNVYNRIVNIISTAFPTIFSPILMTTTSVFYGVTQVTKNTLFQNEFSQEQRATMGSLISFAGSIFFGFMAILLGFVADKITPAKAFLVLQIFQIGNLWFYWKLFGHYRKN